DALLGDIGASRTEQVGSQGQTDHSEDNENQDDPLPCPFQWSHLHSLPGARRWLLEPVCRGVIGLDGKLNDHSSFGWTDYSFALESWKPEPFRGFHLLQQLHRIFMFFSPNQHFEFQAMVGGGGRRNRDHIGPV